jgi:hypothetical protein
MNPNETTPLPGQNPNENDAHNPTPPPQPVAPTPEPTQPTLPEPPTTPVAAVPPTTFQPQVMNSQQPVSSQGPPFMAGNPPVSSAQQGVVYGSHVQVEKGGRGSKKRLILLVCLLVVLALIGAGVFALKNSASPEQIFNDALANNLQTKSFSETLTTTGDTSLNENIASDTSDIKNPIISITGSETDETSGTATIAAYANKKHTYIKFFTFGVSQSQAKALGITDKWVAVENDGKTPTSTANIANSQLPNSIVAVLGNTIVGNFSSTQRQQILDFIHQNKVYSVDFSKASHVTLQGKKAIKYQVKINTGQLKKLNQKVAGMMGVTIDASQLPTEDQNIITLYVDTTTKHMARSVLKHDKSTMTASYSKFNGTSVPAEPTAQMTEEEFSQKLLVLLFGGSATGNVSASGIPAADNTAKDAERQTDINSLEAYLEASYANNGFYPTLAQLNDITWQTANMVGLDAEALIDPNSKSPTIVSTPAANVYAYAPTGCSNGQCAHFTLTATLSTGKTYSKSDLAG